MLKLTVPRALRQSLPSLGGWRSKIPGYKHHGERTQADINSGSKIGWNDFNVPKILLGEQGGPGQPKLSYDDSIGQEYDPWHARATAKRWMEIPHNAEWKAEAIKEYEKWGHRHTHGFDNADPGRDAWLHRRWNLWWVLVCWYARWRASRIPIFFWYMPGCFGRDETWFIEEAIIRIEERVEKGLPLLDPNFCPLDVIDKHVPPPGEWEEEYLSQQPSTYPVLHHMHPWKLGHNGQWPLF